MSEPANFPPATIEAFLRFCEGEWMSLRVAFLLGSWPKPARAMNGTAASGAIWWCATSKVSTGRNPVER